MGVINYNYKLVTNFDITAGQPNAAEILKIISYAENVIVSVL